MSKTRKIYMKNKNSWKEVSEYIKEARKDPEFRKDLKEFIAISSGKKDQNNYILRLNLKLRLQ